VIDDAAKPSETHSCHLKCEPPKGQLPTFLTMLSCVKSLKGDTNRGVDSSLREIYQEKFLLRAH
jgi:hypothetical protein